MSKSWAQLLHVIDSAKLRKELTMQTLMTGLAFGESPRWHDGRLWLSDWGAGEVLAVDGDGKSEVMAQVQTAPFCIDWLPDGRLLVVAGGDAEVLRQEGDRSLVTHASLASVTTKPWNEIVVDGQGRAYVNSIGFDFPDGEFAPGLIALVSPDGSVRQVASDLAFPNGMALTPDGSTLIVAESYAARLTAFSVSPSGELSDRRVWADLGEGAAPDGICLDASGAIWYGDVPNKRCVRVREGGSVLRVVDLELGCFSCALDSSGSTLYMVVADWSADMMAARTGQVLTLAL
jgi:sugar lactone lactonase YvrE